MRKAVAKMNKENTNENLEEITEFPEQTTFNTDDMSVIVEEGE